MNVLVDTPVWSELLRRATSASEPRQQLADLINRGAALLAGPVRQEILRAIRESTQFNRLAQGLRPFPDVEILTADYESAAQYCNQCRCAGIQGSATDFLLCAVSGRLGVATFTLDQDFAQFTKVLPIALFGSDGSRAR